MPTMHEHQRGEIVELDPKRQRKISQPQPFLRVLETFAVQRQDHRDRGDRGGREDGHRRRDAAGTAQKQRDHRRGNQRHDQDQNCVLKHRHLFKVASSG